MKERGGGGVGGGENSYLVQNSRVSVPSASCIGQTSQPGRYEFLKLKENRKKKNSLNHQNERFNMATMQLLVSHGNLPVFMKQWVINENIGRREKRQEMKRVIKKRNDITPWLTSSRSAIYTKSHYRDNYYCFYIMPCVKILPPETVLSILIYTTYISFEFIKVIASLYITDRSTLLNPHCVYMLISYL